MLVSFEWLKDFVDVQASPEEVADTLTMAGLEVEGMETAGGDTVFEVNVTPNRPDCLSVLGIAREVAAAYRTNLKIPADPIDGNLKPSGIKVEISDPELCSRYAGRLISGVTVSESPPLIRERLERCGIRALNNIVDITNYVLLEMGHPLHAFDADKLSGGMIRVARAGADRRIITLDEMERELPDDSLLIWDAKEPVAIAGVMGGGLSSVTSDTKNVFLESAYFAPSSIRRTSKKLGLSTESSYRFERGTDIQFLENALNRAALLIQETGGGEIHDIVDAYPVKFKPVTIEVSYSKVNALLGTNLNKGEITDILRRIGIVTEDSDNFFLARPPAFRRDIQEFVDIVEEVARCSNYSSIPVTNPRTSLPDGLLNPKETYMHKSRGSLRKSGFNEVINYSFMNPSDLELLELAEDDFRRRCIKLKNPLRQEESIMRTTLIPSLINNFLYNFARGIRNLRFYEISKVFIDNNGQLPDEESRIGGIYYQDNEPSIWRDSAPSFFAVKGALQALFEELKINGCSFRPSGQVFLHAGKSADIFCGGRSIGFIGELGPNVTDKLNLKIRKPEIVVFELNADLLFELIPVKLTYAPVPKYPPVARDIAIIIDDTVTSDDVMQAIDDHKSGFIDAVEIFDFYKGKNIPPDRKSLGFRIIYRAPDRTLTDSEVEAMHGALVKHILSRTGGELRGQG